MEEFRKLPPGPKLVIASGATLEAGPARALLADWGGHAANLILLPFTEAPAGTVAARLLAARAAARGGGEETVLNLRMSRRVALEVRAAVHTAGSRVREF